MKKILFSPILVVAIIAPRYSVDSIRVQAGGAGTVEVNRAAQDDLVLAGQLSQCRWS